MQNGRDLMELKCPRKTKYIGFVNHALVGSYCFKVASASSCSAMACHYCLSVNAFGSL